MLFAFEMASLIALCGLAVWSVRPLLEEWGLFRAYQESGLGYIWSIFSMISMRPLHLVPSATQWIVGAGYPIGVGITAALLFAGRYFVVRWAVTPLLHPAHRWLFATIATTLIGWPGLWLARFSPAQFSAIFFFLAVGFGIRVARRPGFARATGVALSIVAMLMTYQALAIAALAIPLLAFLWVPPGQGDLVADRMRRAIWAGLGLTAGAVAYAIYAVVVILPH